MLNYKISISNEIIIFKQYFSNKDIQFLFKILFIVIFLIVLLNNEIFSKISYEKYKIKELEIRNNLKLGSPSKNEFHIDDIVSIFFKNKEKEIFYGINAIIYPENQFINSYSAEIELSKSNFNLVFYNGERLILNEQEKSKTKFDKFTYTLINKKYEMLFKDKDHYNTLELIKHEKKDFRNHGHNKLSQYLFLLFVFITSFKIIFYFKNKKNNYVIKIFIFLLFLMIQILNSYLLYLLDNSENFILIFYYLINIIVFFISTFFILKLIK